MERRDGAITVGCVIGVWSVLTVCSSISLCLLVIAWIGCADNNRRC